jgi:hypothetical protein
MNWLDVAPVALVCVGWLMIPGLLVSYAIGFRSLAAWAVAPTISVAIIATTAVVGGKLGIAWSVPLVLIVSLLVAVVAAALAFALRRRFTVVQRPDPRPVTLTAFLGLIPALLIGALTVVRGMGSPERLAQAYDAIFHYNALAYIEDSHNASSLTLAALGNPGMAGFYPAAWHDMASMVLMTTSASIPVVANVLTAVLSVVVWPLSCVLLVRQIAGRSLPAMAITGALSLGFTAFPWGLMAFGVIWPNLLGLALVPVGVAVALSLSGLAREDAIGKGRAWLMVPFVVIAGGFAHPNSLFSLIAIVVFPVFTGIGLWALRMRAEGRTRRGVTGFGIAAVVFLGGWLFAATSPAFAAVRTYYWPPIESSSKAFGEAVLGAANGRPTLWLISAVVILGVVFLWKVVDQRWLIGAFAASVFLFILTASVNSPRTQAITGYWYNDTFRTAALLPIVGVPLAVLAVVELANRSRDWLNQRERAPLGKFGASTLALTLVLALVVVVAGKGMYITVHSNAVSEIYAGQDDSTKGNVVDARELAFYGRVKNEIPPDAVVAGNPWDGSALTWALIDRRSLFPHVGLPKSDAQSYLAQHLDDAAEDPIVCRDAKALGVSYLILGNLHFMPTNPSVKDYPGLADPAGRPGFELVDSDGDLKLYKLTAC